MHPAWQEFLTQQGASIVEGRVAHFSTPEQEPQIAGNRNIITDLSHLGLLRVGGEDAQTFLQGQVTNDVKLLNGSNSHYAGYCNPKGRLLAILLAFAHQGHFHLQLNGALKEPILKRLKMYVLRSKVVVEDMSDTLIRFGIAGTGAAIALKEHFGSIPEEHHQLVDHETATLLRLPGTAMRFEIFTRPEHASDIWAKLCEHCTPVGSNGWEWHEIQAGIPDVTPATQEAFVPQMLNLDVLGGISFKKGCYTGQEIVARTHYLGTVKRRMHLGHVTADTAPQPGDKMFGTGSAEPVGMVVRVAPGPNGGFDLLYEVRLESLEAGPVLCLTADGPAIASLTLPYVL
ncbi:MAG TPA: folate-binding protein YgfZ [Methylophilaceae bacterium]|jgi:folate-binding protein YgfZ|nr:folate-binding protein YgfZ [Methylophilaceae bacterium]